MFHAAEVRPFVCSSASRGVVVRQEAALPRRLLPWSSAGSVLNLETEMSCASTPRVRFFHRVFLLHCGFNCCGVFFVLLFFCRRKPTWACPCKERQEAEWVWQREEEWGRAVRCSPQAEVRPVSTGYKPIGFFKKLFYPLRQLRWQFNHVYMSIRSSPEDSDE